VILGVAWHGQASGDGSNSMTNEAIFPVQGALFACCLNGVMDTVFQTALLLPTIKPLLFREFRNGYYGLPPLVLSLFAVHGLAQNAYIVALAVPVYALVGLRRTWEHFAVFCCALASLTWLGAAVGIGVGAFVDTFQDAQAAVVPLLIPLILFSGYLIPYAQIPSYFRFFYDVSFFQHAIAILEINQFKEVRFSDCPPNYHLGDGDIWVPWDDDAVRTTELGAGGDDGGVSRAVNVSWTCSGVAQLLANATAADSNGDDDEGGDLAGGGRAFLFQPGGVVDTCSAGGQARPSKESAQGRLPCFVDGRALLKELHVDPSALTKKFVILALYVAGALLLAYLCLFRSLKSFKCSHSLLRCRRNGGR